MKQDEVCQFCTYWRLNKESTEVGQCHRYPPRGIEHPEHHLILPYFPRTDALDFCGEFKRQER